MENITIERLTVINSFTGSKVLLRTNYSEGSKKFVKRQWSKQLPSRELASQWILENEDNIRKSENPQETFAELIKSIKEYDKMEFKPVIVKFNEKHGDRFFLAYNVDDYENICMYIFKERDTYGQYNHIMSVVEPEKPTFEKEMVETFPTELQEKATEKWDNYIKDMKYFNEMNQLKKLIEKARSGDTTCAKELIEKISQMEYNSMEIITTENY